MDWRLTRSGVRSTLGLRHQIWIEVSKGKSIGQQSVKISQTMELVVRSNDFLERLCRHILD